MLQEYLEHYNTPPAPIALSAAASRQHSPAIWVRPFGRCDEIASVAWYTSMRRSRDVTEFPDPQASSRRGRRLSNGRDDTVVRPLDPQRRPAPLFRPLRRRPQLTPFRRHQSKNLTPFGDNSQSQQRLAPVSLQVARAPPAQTIIVDQPGVEVRPVELQKQEPQRQRVEVELRGFEPLTP